VLAIRFRHTREKRLAHNHLQIHPITAVLYVGRAVFFLLSNTLFSLVYLKARRYDQGQAANKMWITMWHVAVSANMGVVAVYSFHQEFALIAREAKNGLVRPMTYVLARSILAIPMIFCFAIFALALPSIVIMDFPADKFATAILLWSACMYVFECAAECFSVWVEDLIMGMLVYIAYWFGFLLFGGFLVGVDELVWPMKVFYYILPCSYYLRTQMYNLLIDTKWSVCDPSVGASSACVPDPTGENVLNGMSAAFPVIVAEDTFTSDLLALVSLALFFKGLYIAGVIFKTSKTVKFSDTKRTQDNSQDDDGDGQNSHTSLEWQEPFMPPEPIRLEI
jgi:ABC-2 type transporter